MKNSAEIILFIFSYFMGSMLLNGIIENPASDVGLKEIIDKLILKSYLFSGLSRELICNGLKNYRISIVKFKTGHTVIHDGDSDCRFFYLLLKGSVSVLKGGKKICDINQISLIGELGFFNKNIKRTASIVCNEEVYMMKFEESFLDHLSLEDKLKIFQNVIQEISTRLDCANKIIIDNKPQKNHSVDQISTAIEDSIFTVIK